MPLTQALGQFVADLSPNRVPDEAMRIARLGFIDCIATMIVGRTEDCTKILKNVLAPVSGPASLYFSGEKVQGPEAGWINGTAAHALDYDDVAMLGHPSTVLVPAILAEAEVLNVTGQDMLIAYIAGYEAWAECVRRDEPHYHGKGWHPTGIMGAVATAAACAKLRKLDPHKAAIAIALGASQAGGIMANFGTMTKPFHAGRSAHAGIIAARLAEAGFTANTDALEHPQGFLSAVSPFNNPNREGDGNLGQDWAIIRNGLNIKKYPACYGTHRAIDAMLDLLAKNPSLKPDDVANVKVQFGAFTSKVLRNHQPDTGLAAKFSMEFAMASSLINRRVGLNELTDGFVQRADVQDMMRKVERDLTDDPSDAEGFTPFEQVWITTKAGTVLESEKVVVPLGHAKRPLTDQRMYEKFADCLNLNGSAIPVDTLFGRLQSMQSITARELTAV